MLTRRASLSVILVFLGLLSLFQVQSGLAVFGTIWDAFPSWDNPATNDFEASASITPPYTDPARQLSGHEIAAACPAGRLPLGDAPNRSQTHAGSSRITRSPPAA